MRLLQLNVAEYMETYAPVVNIIRVRMFFVVVFQMDLELEKNGHRNCILV